MIRTLYRVPCTGIKSLNHVFQLVNSFSMRTAKRAIPTARAAPDLTLDNNIIANPNPIPSSTKAPVDAAVFRTEKQITLLNEGSGNLYVPFTSFGETPFPDSLKRVFAREGYTEPTVIQAQSWPIALQKRDMISVAKTGSGKTCAFLLPAIHTLIQDAKKPPVQEPGTRRRVSRRGSTKVLVLVPTRELAVQIDEEAKKFTRAAELNSVAIYGGSSKFKQISELRRGADIIIATPGRCNDLIESGDVDLSQVSYLVLDEADRMLDMGFMPQIETIIGCTQPTRQNLFFTATWPKEVQNFADTYLSNPVHIRVGDVSGKLTANKDISQNIKIVHPKDKYDELLDLLEYLNADENKSPRALAKTLVFVSRKHECDDLVEDLRQQGYSVDSLHGDKSQLLRDRAMTRFKGNQLQILVATDVAGRGLDVKDIRHVINYDFPAGSNGVEDYVHRIGRTGRAGVPGKAFTFFTKQDEDRAAELIGVLERSEQYIPPLLQELADNVNNRKNRSSQRGGRGGGRGSGGRGGGGRGGGGRSSGQFEGRARSNDRFNGRANSDTYETGPRGRRPPESSDRAEFRRGDRYGSSFSSTSDQSRKYGRDNDNGTQEFGRGKDNVMQDRYGRSRRPSLRYDE